MTKQKTRSLRAAIAVAVFTAAALCTTATNARADTIVFNNAPGAGTQENFVLGMDFDVLQAIEVTQLGVFDSAFDGLIDELTVGIFDLSSSGPALVQTQVSGLGTSNDGSSRFVSISPFLLGPGSYSIVASGFINGNRSGNTGFGDGTSFNNLGGRLAIVPGGGRWATGTTFGLPTKPQNYSQADPVFQAGTFQANAVPDGGSAAALLGLGLLGVGWARRRLR
jgi:hypothetical protein